MKSMRVETIEMWESLPIKTVVRAVWPDGSHQEQLLIRCEPGSGGGFGEISGLGGKHWTSVFTDWGAELTLVHQPGVSTVALALREEAKRLREIQVNMEITPLNSLNADQKQQVMNFLDVTGMPDDEYRDRWFAEYAAWLDHRANAFDQKD